MPIIRPRPAGVHPCSRPPRRPTVRAAALTMLLAAPIAVTGLVGSPAAGGSVHRLAAVEPRVAVAPSTTPAFAQDAPDPDVVASGGTYYAFTTGTALGNNLQALVDTTGNPT